MTVYKIKHKWQAARWAKTFLFWAFLCVKCEFLSVPVLISFGQQVQVYGRMELVTNTDDREPSKTELKQLLKQYLFGLIFEHG